MREDSKFQRTPVRSMPELRHDAMASAQMLGCAMIALLTVFVLTAICLLI